MGRIYNAICKFVATQHIYLLMFFIITFFILFINLDQFADVTVLKFIFNFGPVPPTVEETVKNNPPDKDFIVNVENPDSVRILNVYMDTWVKVIFGYAISLNYGIIVALVSIIIFPFMEETYRDRSQYVNFSRTYYIFLLMGIVVFYILTFSGSFIVPVYIFQYAIWFILGILLILIPYSSYRMRNKRFRKRVPVKTEI